MDQVLSSCLGIVLSINGPNPGAPADGSGAQVDAFIIVDGVAVAETEPLVLETAPEAGDERFRYEGPVLETEGYAVRMYIDGRNRFDLFGKNLSSNVLRHGRSDYHQVSAWGRDVLKVGDTVGFGSVVEIEDGSIKAVATDSARTVRTHRSSDEAYFEIEYSNGPVRAHKVSAEASDPWIVHDVKLRHDGREDVATGLVAHEAAEFVLGSVGEVRYILTFGAQSDLGEPLGLALLYDPSGTLIDVEGSHLVRLSSESGSARYWTAATWGVRGAKDLVAWHQEVSAMALSLSLTAEVPYRRDLEEVSSGLRQR